MLRINLFIQNCLRYHVKGKISEPAYAMSSIKHGEPDDGFLLVETYFSTYFDFRRKVDTTS
jgi:hypothetical protein